MSDNLAHFITYDIQQLKLNADIVSGVQSVSYNYSAEISPVITWGNPFVVKTMYKKPSVTLSMSKFISSDAPALGVNKDLFPKPSGTKPSLQTIQILTRTTPDTEEKPLTQLEFNDVVINSINYTFQTQGFFTEEVTFAGHSLRSGIINPNGVFSRTEASGLTKRRADFYASGLPVEVQSLINKGAALTSVALTIGFQYGEYPAYGNFYTASNKYVKYPYDITCAFELIDRGYACLTDKYEMLSGRLNASQTKDISLSTIFKSTTGNPIRIGIKDTLDINLGTGNYLQSSERSGGDAGQGNYTTYKYTYKNNTSSFSISGIKLQ
jgi:hypothetical protein